MSETEPEHQAEAPERDEAPGDPANDNGSPSWDQQRFEQTYPNAGMTAEERPEIPESGIEESPEPPPEEPPPEERA